VIDAFGVQREPVSKVGRKKRAVAIGAATTAGAGAGQMLYLTPAIRNEKVIKPKFDAARETWTDDQKKRWQAHNRPPGPHYKGRHSANPTFDPGFRGTKEKATQSQPDGSGQRPFTRAQDRKMREGDTRRSEWRASNRFWRTMPDDVPYGKMRRYMSYAGKGKIGHATSLATIGAGALLANRVASHKIKPDPVKKGWEWGWQNKSIKRPLTLIHDPGFVVPAVGIAGAGAAATTLALRRKNRKRKK
jgi:hypothetical protein